MVVPDYQMLENVQKIAAALSDDPVKVQIIPFGAEMVASQIFFFHIMILNCQNWRSAII